MKEHSKAENAPLCSVLVTLGNRCLIRKSKPLPFHSLKMFAYLHLFRLNIKGGIGWLRPCNAEQLQCARAERSDPLVTAAWVSSPAPFMCPSTHFPYWVSQIGPAEKCSDGFQHQQHIFLVHEEPAQVRCFALFARLHWTAVHVSNSTKYTVRERFPGDLASKETCLSLWLCL